MATVRILRSTTPGNTPASLVSGQIAINEADGVLFYRASGGAVTQLATGGGATEVAEYASASNFPATGSAGVLYIDKDRSKVFRWNNAYVELGPVGGVGIEWAAVPASETSPGLPGQAAYDLLHFYVCVEDNYWSRIPFPAWGSSALTGIVATEAGGVLAAESGDPFVF